MPLPERLKPIRPNRKKMKEMAVLLQSITDCIYNGAAEEDEKLQLLMSEWNRQSLRPFEYHEFRDFHSYTDAKEFTKSALNKEKYVNDLTFEEFLAIISFVCNAEGSEADGNYALFFLKENFNANPSDLIYYPNEWFNNPELFHVDLSNEEIAGYLKEKSGRHLPDAPN